MSITSLLNGENGENGENGSLSSIDQFTGRMMSPYTTGAMISAYDGIVGPWQDTANSPSHNPTDFNAEMHRWSPRVRSHVLHFELIESLWFKANKDELDRSGGKIKAVIYNEDPDAASTTQEKNSHQLLTGDIVKLNRPDPEDFRKNQLPLVRGYADLRRDRLHEIFSQLSGHVDFFSGIGFLHRERTRWTNELISILLKACVTIEMRIKHSMACRRPVEYSSQIHPMIETPGHGTFPSGHATEAFMIAYVLSELISDQEQKVYGANRVWRDQLMRMAARIAVNRVVAGVHFPIDNAAGQVLGLCLGKYFIARCMGEKTSFHGWKFKGYKYGARDFPWQEINTCICEDDSSLEIPEYLGKRGKFMIPKDDSETGDEAHSALNWLWNKARQEWLDVGNSR